MNLRTIPTPDFLAAIALHEEWARDIARGAAAPAGLQLSLVDAEIAAELTLTERDLTAAEMVRCRLRGVAFERCTLSSATLDETRFERCRFHHCRFVKAEMQGVDARGVDFTGSDLTRADLTGASLRDADLTGCRLDWAWLVETDLRDAVLDGTQFVGARLARAKMDNRGSYRLGSLKQARIEDVEVTSPSNGDADGGGPTVVAVVGSVDELLAHLTTSAVPGDV